MSSNIADNQLLSAVNSMEEDFKYYNEQIRSMEDMIASLKTRRENDWPRFYELLTEAKRRGLIRG